MKQIEDGSDILYTLEPLAPTACYAMLITTISNPIYAS